MRLIDADAITYELWTTEVDSNRDNYRYFQNRYMVDRRDIESMPTVQRWIPCSERLPDEGEVVLTQAKFKDDIKMAVSARVDFNYWTGWGTREINIVAWMPLPQPYRGDDK